LATLDKFQRDFTTKGAELLAGAGPLSVVLEAFFDFAVSVYADDELGCFLFGTAPAASGDDPEIQAALASGLGGVRTALKQRLSNALGFDLLPGADPEGLAVSLTGVLLTLALFARAGAAASELRTMHRRASKVILLGSCSVELPSAPAHADNEVGNGKR